MPQILSKQELQAQNQGIFNAVATRYDFMNKITSLGMEPFWKRRAVRCQASVNDNSLVLDLCGGTGDLTNLALRMFGGGQYTVFDLNAAMLDAGKAKIPANLREHVTYLQGDAMYLPFADNTFDNIMICFGLRNVPDMQGCLNEIARTLKPRSQLVALEFAVPANAFWRLGYRIYMTTFVRLVTTLVTGHRGAYRYLADSITRFPPPEEVLNAITNTGLVNQKQIKLFCGVGYIYVANKHESALPAK